MRISFSNENVATPLWKRQKTKSDNKFSFPHRLTARGSAPLPAGVWATKLGEMAGVKVPLIAMHHAYVVTERIEGIQVGTLSQKNKNLQKTQHARCLQFIEGLSVRASRKGRDLLTS